MADTHSDAEGVLERRQGERVEAQGIPIRVYLYSRGEALNEQMQHAVSVDLSRDGAQLSLRSPVPKGATVGMEIGIPVADHDIKARGRVVWALEDGTPRMGVSLVDMSPSDRALYDQYVHTLLLRKRNASDGERRYRAGEYVPAGVYRCVRCGALDVARDEADKEGLRLLPSCWAATRGGSRCFGTVYERLK
jgi:hypothetical protein